MATCADKSVRLPTMVGGTLLNNSLKQSKAKSRPRGKSLKNPTLGFISRNENLSRSMVGSEAKSIDLQIFIDSDRG